MTEIVTKAQHIAEAERVLDQLRDMVGRAMSVGVPMEAIPAASVALAYAQAHAALAQAFGGVAEPADLRQAREKVATAPPAPANGSRLVVPQLGTLPPN